MKYVSIASCCLSLLAALPASAQIVRVSVSTAGAEANQFSSGPTISANGRYVAFYSAADNLVANDTNISSDIFLRDRDTDADGVYDEAGAVATTRLSVGASDAQANAASYVPVMTPDARYVFYVSSATNIVAGLSTFTPRLFRLDRTTGTTILVAPDPAFLEFYAASANGDVVVYRSTTDPLRLTIRQISTDEMSLVPAPYVPTNPATETLVFSMPSISADGNRIAYQSAVSTTGVVLLQDPRTYVFDRQAGTSTLVAGDAPISATIDAAGTAVGLRFETRILKRVIASGAETASFPNTPIDPLIGRYHTLSPSGRWDLTGGRLTDYALGVSTPLPIQVSLAAISTDDRWLALTTGMSTLVGGDTNNVDDVFVMDIPDYFDADDDTMDDRWETLFSVTDPTADPDTDGQTNAQEEDAGTHPNGQVRRFLAEGATGPFFRTTIGLANPSPTLAATAVLTFDRGDGTRVRRPIAIPAGRSAAVDVGAVTGVETADVSTTVESDRLLGVERSMTWGASADAIYGSHSETATTAPSATWFLAEGTTVLGFDLFYLLQNPQATTAHVTVRFLLPSGTIVTRTYDLAPGSRTTVYVNQIDGLAETDVSGDITADVPIVVERAMYRGTPDQPFALGTDSMGVTAAGTSWFLAEGATGTFFDLFVLIANPGASDATVQALYARPDGSTVTQTYTVRAHSRFSVYVDSVPGLEATSVATTLTSTVPIVAERAMYWPGGFFDYYEGHSAAGSTSTALEWVVSGGDAGGVDAAQTFVLIANTANATGEATLTVLPDSGFSGTAPAPIVVSLPANSRTTVPLTAVAGTFGVRVVSTGGAPVPLVVESAVYRSAGGVVWSAGSNALATPVVP